jgi:hypothetical protein
MSWINHEDDSSLEAELEEGFARMFSSEELGRAQDWVNWLDEVCVPRVSLPTPV